MPKTKLDDAVNALRKWFLLFSLEEFVAGDLSRSLFPSTGAGAVNVLEPGQDAIGANIGGAVVQPGGEVSATIQALASIIVNSQRGGFTSPVIIQKINDVFVEFQQAGLLSPQSLSQLPDLLDIVTPFYESSVVAGSQTNTSLGSLTSITEVLGKLSSQEHGGINSNPRAPSKDSPTVSMLFNKTTQIALSNKNGNALSIFFNAIPTMEWSRAIPFIELKFQYQRPSISSDNRAITPSVVRFLDGSAQLSPVSSLPGGLGAAASSLSGGGNDSLNLKLQTAVSVDDNFSLTGDSNPDGIGESGTELFLLPQTLVNANSSESEDARITPVIDIFRPLASLRKFEVDVSQAAGMIAYRTAKLSFTLHDRSRLHEIADFIKAGLYNKTEMLIDWGWEHPDKSGDNVFADFINGMKIKEKYQISNYDLRLKTNGEVDIDLSIFTKGGVDLYTSKIADSDDTIEPQELVRQLQERISQLRNRIFKQDQNFVEEVRGQQILSTAGDNNASITLKPELRRELRKTLSQLSGNPSESAKELRKALEDLYGKDGTNGAARELVTTIADRIDTKMQAIKGRPVIAGGTKTPDPFLSPKTYTPLKKDQFVSLAKLLLIFVVQPLALTKKFDDIQVIFYNMNDHAGFGSNKNLGEFPIEIGNFQKNFKKLGTQRRTPNIVLQEFIRFISNRYLEDISNPLYGLRDFYRYEPDKETGKRNIPVKKFKNNPTALNSAIEERMREAGVPDGIFKLPQVDFYVECIPSAPDGEGEAESIFESLTILRIHVFDKLATSYEGQQAFLAAQRRDSIRSLGNIPVSRENEDKFKTSVKDIVTKAEESNLIEVVRPLDGKGSNTVVKFKGGPREIKNFIAQTMPTMFFGVNNTSVLDAGLKTLQDQKLTTINMINAGDKGDLTPNGGATNGLPIRLFPAQMNMRLLGCPIMEFTQSIFCDFGTGTSFDNIYAATKIQHSLEPGKFYTSVVMTPLDAYGQYQSAVQKVGDAIAILSEFDGTNDQGQIGIP